MNLHNILTNVGKKLKSNAPEILTALGVSGVITTAYLTGKASYAAAGMLSEEPPDMTLKERFHHTWRLYIPPSISGVVTIGCIIGSTKGHGKRTTAAVTAYSLTELAFSEYRDKVVEQIGKGKEQAIRDEIVQDKITRYPTTSREVIVVGGGHVLCCELYTHRYFRSDMETLRKAQNDINAKIISTMYVTLDEFYDLIGLPSTSNASKMGWDSDRMMEMQFSTVMAEGGEPCLAFEYNYVKPI